jgi:hypothetical protein
MQVEAFRGDLKRADWPACLLGHPKQRGIYVGGCVARGRGSSFRAKAHSHIHGQWFGWICVRSGARLSDDALMLHELAHILVEQGHTDTWRKRLLELGGTLERTGSLRSYQKVKRLAWST